MEETNKGGRPTKYDPKFEKQVFKLSLLGATDKEIADFFEISEATVNNWKLEHPKFLESIKKGKEEADAKVVQSLFKRAVGTSIPDSYALTKKAKKTETGEAEETVEFIPLRKHLPPDVTAQIFWLKNRQPEKWRDSHNIEARVKHEKPNEIDLTKLSEDELEKLIELQSKARISPEEV